MKYLVRVLIVLVVGYVLFAIWQRVGLYRQLYSGTVKSTTILSLTKGESFKDARTKLGPAVRHEFTVTQPEGTYTLVSCLGPDPDGSRFWFLFHNGILEKRIHPPEASIDIVAYQGTTASLMESWDIDDQGRISDAIDGPDLTDQQITNDLTPYSGKGESWNVVPAFLIVGMLTPASVQTRYMKHMQDEYRANAEFLRRYDGCRVQLGMSGVTIEAMFGKPMRIFAGKNGETVRAYGRAKVFDVRPENRFSGMAVVNDSKDRVTAVYGDQFFADKWAGREGSF